MDSQITNSSSDVGRKAEEAIAYVVYTVMGLKQSIPQPHYSGGTKQSTPKAAKQKVRDSECTSISGSTSRK